MRTLLSLTLTVLFVAGPALAQDSTRRAGDLTVERETMTLPDGTAVEAELCRLIVPENRSDPESNLIEIAFARIKSIGKTPHAPLVYLAGGPGSSSTGNVNPGSLQRWRPVLEICDLIFLDQRATGRSTPSLRYRSEEPPPRDIFADAKKAKAYFLNTAREAAKHYRAQGVDLDGYNSVESAHDINDLRLALGLEKVSLVGFSYGTHLAQATIREHGEHLENVIAIGVEGLHQTHKLPLFMDTQYRKLAILAAEDDEVGPYVPDLVGLTERVFAKLEREPMMVEVTDDDELITVPVGKFGLQFIIRRDLGDASDLPVFPKLLYSIDQGDPSVLQWFVQKRWPSGNINLMSLIMDGASGASPERWAMIEAQAQESMFGDVALFFWPDVDEATGVRDLGEAYRAPLVSNVRTLFLTGSLDWNTPPHQAEEIRWGMPNTTHIIVENAGHEQILPQPEVQATMVSFLKGQDVRDVTVMLPRLRFVPIEDFDPKVTHPSAGLARALLATTLERGLDSAISDYRALRARHDFDAEREINQLGYRLLARKRIDDAITVFAMNVEDYPESWNVYDSLAEGYKEKGDRKRSIELYEKSLEINPDNTNGIKMLEELGAP